MTLAYLTDTQICEMFQKSTGWLRKTRAALEAEGFPPKDRLVGLTLAADVNAWLARRRVLADREPAADAVHHITPPKERLNAL